jgi:hypothetical protein
LLLLRRITTHSARRLSEADCRDRAVAALGRMTSAYRV